MIETTEDSILRGLVRVVQPRQGYRFSLDALLLADFAARLPGERILDLGCGSGVIGLVLAARRPSAEVVGLEIQPELCEVARRGARLNGMADRFTVIETDARDAGAPLPLSSFDLAVCNPPYFAPRHGPASPHRGRAQGRHAITLGIDDVVAAARRLLRPDGRLALIHPEPRLSAAAGAAGGLHLRALRPVVPREGRPARRYLIEMGLPPHAAPEEQPPLVVHEGAGYTPELRRLLGDDP